MLVERETQLTIFSKLLEDEQRADAGIVVISGPVGSGKSALLQVMERRTEASHYLRALCSSAESAVPFAMIDQLCGGLDLPSPCLDGRPLADALPAVQHGLWRIISKLAETERLVISVDDAHFADEASLAVLLYVLRRLRSAKVMVIITESQSLDHTNKSRLISEILHLRWSRHVSVSGLSKAGIARLMGASSGITAAAVECHRITGGSPALVWPLLKDSLGADVEAGRGYEFSPGDGFRQALSNILCQCEGTLREIAYAVAVLGHARDLDVLQEFTGLSPMLFARARIALERMGLLDDGAFRHDAIRAAILDTIAAAARSHLHAQLARTLHIRGESETRIAAHLKVANRIDEPWVTQVLTSVARKALTVGHADQAVDTLRLAYQVSSGEQRYLTKMLLAEAEWQLDPSAAARHLPEITSAVSAGQLADPSASLISFLLWAGHVDAAQRVHEKLSAEAPSALAVALPWLPCVYPDHFHDASLPAEDMPFPASVESGNQVKSCAVLYRAITCGAEEAAVAEAEQLLETLRTEESQPGLAALATLLCAERADKAAHWCDRLLADLKERGTPTRRALFAASRAMIAIREGDLASAERHARLALSILPAEAWGVSVGIPLASILLVHTAKGDFAAAAEVLRTPVPSAMFDTPVGLIYLHARGRYHLAIKRYLFAMDDFRKCGFYLKKWGFDIPGIVPWRTETARVHIALEQAAEAKALLEEELSRLGADQCRTRGIALLVLGSVTEAAQRVPLLEASVRELRRSGDRLELGSALARLAEARGTAGYPAAAGFVIPCSAGAAGINGKQLDPFSAAPEDPLGHLDLSTAELRVAELAARGLTNRQISSKLFITVSTVEQHLTRVYRKLRVLNVNRRSDLQSVFGG